MRNTVCSLHSIHVYVSCLSTADQHQQPQASRSTVAQSNQTSVTPVFGIGSRRVVPAFKQQLPPLFTRQQRVVERMQRLHAGLAPALVAATRREAAHPAAAMVDFFEQMRWRIALNSVPARPPSASPRQTQREIELGEPGLSAAGSARSRASPGQGAALPPGAFRPTRT